MTILVTGSAGHLGEALVRLLRERNEPVRGLDILPSPFTNIVGSVVDPSICQGAMKDVTAVLHTASLHKPHVETHRRQDFVDVNITGTLNLLEAAVASKSVKAFVFTSTTSTFGDALRPGPDDTEAVWIEERVQPKPKNIYGVTKLAAEDLCQLFHRLYKLPCIVLKVSRFFPEDDDSKEVRETCSSNNAKVNELLYRRADIFDMATAHFAAMEQAPKVGFDRFVISGPNPFTPGDRALLYTNPESVICSYFPEARRIFKKKGYKFFPSMDRIYRSNLAMERLGWSPVYTFEKALESLDQDQPVGSELARIVGSKMYHNGDVTLAKDFDGADGGAPYPTS